MYDVAIIGAGPAGLTAAIVLASEGRSVVVFEKREQVGGLISHSSLVQNVPPFSRGFPGSYFRQESYEQALYFGVEFQLNTPVIEVEWAESLLRDGRFLINGDTEARAVILAVGAESRMHTIPVLGDLTCHVSYTPELFATQRWETVTIVGGGNSAGQAAIHYYERGSYVRLIARRPLKATMSDYLVKQLDNHPVILVYQGEVEEIEGKYLRLSTGEIVATNYVHFFLGFLPSTSWLCANALVHLDNQGYIMSSRYPGVFAIGDVVSGSNKRVLCAMGSAGNVVPQVHAYLDGRV